MSPTPPEGPEVVFLSHAVDRSGPPVYLLHLLGWVRANTAARTHVVSLTGGALADRFREVTDLRIVGEPWPVRVRRGSRPLTALRDAARRYRVRGLDPNALVHVNTAWSVRALRFLPEHRGPVVAHVHELATGLDYHLLPADRRLLFERSDHWVAASQAVAAGLDRFPRRAAEPVIVHHEMIDVGAIQSVSAARVAERRASLGVGEGECLVGTAAVLNWRKGPDLFVELAARALTAEPSLRFAWLGVDPTTPEAAALRRDLRRAGIADRVHVVAAADDPEVWHRAFDAFVLTAREDAYPLAGLEAAAAGRPVVCFDAGGMPEFVRDDAGRVVDYPDVGAMSATVVDLAADSTMRAALGAVGARRVRADHDVAVAAPRLWADLRRWAR